MKKTAALLIIALIVLSSIFVYNILVIDQIPEDTEYEIDSPTISEIQVDGKTWVAYDGSQPGTQAETHVLVSDTTGITLVAYFHGFWKNEYNASGVIYDDLEMPGASSMRAFGKPMLPQITEFVEIPYDIDATLEILANASAIEDDYKVKPAPEFLIPDNNTWPIQPTPEDAIYSVNALFPISTCTMIGDLNNSAMIMRGRRLLELTICPFQINPVEEELTLYSVLKIKINYDKPAQIVPVNSSYLSHEFESVFERIILNFIPGPFLYQGVILTYPEDFDAAEYMIITTSEFEDQADRLARWKTQKGTLAKVRTVAKGASCAQIEHEIWTAYKYWSPAPSYVLLLGDSDDISPCYKTRHPSKIDEDHYTYGDSGYIASDLHYFTLEGNDYFPEMFYGRISVEDHSQAVNAVNKILAYEREPNLADEVFYNTIMAAAYFDDLFWNEITGVWEFDGKENNEDLAFVWQSEQIISHLQTKGYDIVRNYSTWTGQGYDGPGIMPNTYWDGTSLSQELLNYEWIECARSSRHLAAANITANFNEGRFFAYYLDHGMSKNQFDFITGERSMYDGWIYPTFNVTDTPGLTNDQRLSFVISAACSTGWFDGETDEFWMDDERFEECALDCLAEYLTRSEYGAIAVVAPTRNAYALPNREMLNGIIQAIWPGMISTYQNQPIYEMGAALLFGKLHSYKMYNSPPNPDGSISGGDVTRTMFEEFHLFGDPESQLWTSLPSEFNVTYPISVGTSNPQRFVVKVRNMTSNEPVHYAKVCIQQEGIHYMVGYTDPMGQAIFDIDPVAYPNITLTVTKHNFKPFIVSLPVFDSYATVTISEHAKLVGEEIYFSVYGFDEGLPVEIYFDDTLVLTLPAGDNSGPEVVPAGFRGYVNVWAVQQTMSPYPVDWNPVSVERFLCLTTEDGPNPYIYSLVDGTTWGGSSADCLFDNPDILVLDQFQFNDNDITVTVHNHALIEAVDTNVTLSYAPHGGGLSWTLVERKEVTIPASGSNQVGFSWNPLLPLDVCLKVELQHDDEALLDRFDNIGQENVGIIPLTSPGEYEFLIGNPTQTNDSIFVSVRQNGGFSDILHAEIMSYSLQMTNSGENESIRLRIDPESKLAVGEWQLFTVYLYINRTLVGGITFNATQLQSIDWVLVIVITCAAVGTLFVIVAGVKKFRT